MPPIKLYFRTMDGKPWGTGTKDISRLQQNPTMNPSNFSYLIFYKATKNAHWRKGGLFKRWWWEPGISIQKIYLGHIFHLPKNQPQAEGRP